MTGRIGLALHDFALGGTERIAVRLATEWARSGFDVEIVCGDDVGPLRALLGGEVSVFAPPKPITRGEFFAVRRLAEFAKSRFALHPVDGLYVPGNYHWPVARAIAQLPPGIRPIIVAQVSSALQKPQRTGLRQLWFERRMRRQLRSAQHIVTMSKETENIARRIMPASSISTIRLPVLSDEVSPPVSVPAGPPVLVSAGRLVRSKGFLTLIDAFALLAHPTARLVIVGAGPDGAAIRRRIAKFKLHERVHLAGFAPDIREWLDRSRLFILASQHEGFGAVIVEALGAGRQVVVTDCTPAAHDLLRSPMAGRVVPIDDAQALADAIKAVLAGPLPDPETLTGYVEPYRIGPIARSYLSLMGLA